MVGPLLSRLRAAICVANYIGSHLFRVAHKDPWIFESPLLVLSSPDYLAPRLPVHRGAGAVLDGKRRNWQKLLPLARLVLPLI
jgi:hypothetical protein